MGWEVSGGKFTTNRSVIQIYEDDLSAMESVLEGQQYELYIREVGCYCSNRIRGSKFVQGVTSATSVIRPCLIFPAFTKFRHLTVPRLLQKDLSLIFDQTEIV